MLGRRSFKLALAAAAVAAGALGPVTSATAGGGGYTDPTMNLPRHLGKMPGIGPRSPFVQEIMINTVVPMKNKAIINKTAYGYLFRAGQQNSNLTVTASGGRLVFKDAGTASWKWLPRACSEVSVSQGVGASCKIPARYTMSNPMLLEFWPRLGDDTIDTSALSAQFDASVLGDKGNDTFRGGAGYDFFNGAQDNDKAWGGGGRDWIRTGLGADTIDGGADGDFLVGVDGNDTLYSGTGDDRLSCGGGSDTAYAKSSDKANDCESVHGY